MQHSLWQMYSRIQNGVSVRKKSVFHPKNTLCVDTLKILYKEGYINGFRINSENSRFVEIFLKYSHGKPALEKIFSPSKPGRRLYVSVKTLCKLRTSLTTLILSTSKGLLSDKDCRKMRSGGEVLCAVY
jgi:small subunit ribosomal protein S8